MNEIRIGYVSTYNESTGMATIHYPDRCGEVTAEMPVFAPFGLRQKLKKGDCVQVAHLSNGSEAGVVIGTYSSEGDVSQAWIETDGNTLRLHDSSGSISISEILAIKRAHESEGE